MEKIMFMPEGSDKPASFYVLEQTKIRGFSYILVTDRQRRRRCRVSDFKREE